MADILNQSTSWYETLLREYEAALGRFHQVDPLASASMQFSPYAFAFNDPVSYNDPAGAYPENTYSPMPYSYDSGSGGGATGFGPDFGPLQFGQHFYGAGSANDWMNGYRSVEGNARVMSQSQFNSYYGIASDTDRARVAAGAYSGSGAAAEYADDIAAFLGNGAEFTGSYFRVPSYELKFIEHRDGNAYYNYSETGIWIPIGGQQSGNLQAQQGGPGGTITPPANNSGPNWLSAFSGVAGIWGIATEISITGPKPVNLYKANWANQVKAGMKFSRGLNTAGLALTAIDMGINGPDASNSLDAYFGVASFGGPVGAEKPLVNT